MGNIGKMMTVVLKKCDILLDKQVISKEVLLEKFCGFLSSTIEKEKHNTGIILHTGSICFDAILIIYSAVACIAENGLESQDIIASLKPGSRVLYGEKKQKRYFFRGIEIDANGNERVVLSQSEGHTMTLGKSRWHLIVPYHGEATSMDGRGIRKKNHICDVFFQEILGYARTELSSIIDKSAIIVMERSRAEYLINELAFRTGEGVIIPLLELVTASYFTEGEEYPFGGNVGKNEAVLKITGKVSVARELYSDRERNKHIGVIICGNDMINRNYTELPALMNRKSLTYVYLSAGMDSEYGLQAIKEIESAEVFACTKDFLLDNTLQVKEENRFTSMLEKQIDWIIDKEIVRKIVPGPLKWKEYQAVKRALKILKNCELTENERNMVIIPAYSLLKLFMTAVFPIQTMENMIEAGKIKAESPGKSLERIEAAMKKLPENVCEQVKLVMDVLENLYLELLDKSEKEEQIKIFLRENCEKKIALVVPKMYYADIIKECRFYDCLSDYNKLSVMTPGKFDNSMLYDVILVVGDFEGRKFNPYICYSTSKIQLFLYAPEEKVSVQKQKWSEEREELCNRRSTIRIATDEKLSVESGVEMTDKEISEIREIDAEMEDYIFQYDMAAMEAIHINKSSSGNNATSEIIVAVQFETGEYALLTKRYKAYVLDEYSRDVREVKGENLREGDMIIFTRNNDETKDAVDYVLNLLISGKRIKEEVVEAYYKSRKWKEELIQYLKESGSSEKEIAQIMIANGVSVQEPTIRKWLDEDAHTVGPRKVDSIQQIALLTGNEDMFENAEAYFESCRIIRSVRRQILKEIGASILGRFSGETNGNIVPPEILDKIDTLAEALKIERILPMEKIVPVYLANKPISLQGGF